MYIRDRRSPTPKDELTSRIMSSIKAKDTKPELILRKSLWREGIKGYRIHWKKAPGRPDIAFPKRNWLSLLMVVFGIDALIVCL